jgi:hypothetical protein
VVNSTQSVTSGTIAATKNTTHAAVTKTEAAKAKTTTAVQNSGKKAVNTVGDVKNDAKNSADIKASADVKSNTQASGNINNSGSVQTDLNNGVSSGAAVEVNGGKVIDKTEKITTTAGNEVKDKTASTVQTTKDVKANTVSAAKSDVQAGKDAAGSVKTSGTVSATVKSESQVKTSHQ